MKNAGLLDCTLRDGAYLIDKKFGDLVICGIILGLKRAGINYIEIGFLQDEGFGEGKTVFKNASDAARFIPENKESTKFAVLADYSRYSIDNLEDNPENSFDIVRECFFKHERYDAIAVCHKIKEKGYKVFVQPVDILGYTDLELIELISMVNELEPFGISIVDTFGSMYEDDLQRVFSLIDHNLICECKIGFHSHNNLQMSSALSQYFLKMSMGRRKVIVDATLSGMGRGAGNTPTELIAQYMVSRLGYTYDIDVLLDLIDEYMDNIRSRCSWGYSTSYFIAGTYSSHVNNVTYLTKKNSIRSRDIRYILNKIGSQKRKRYHYDLLEETYLEYLRSNIDDSHDLKALEKEFKGRNIVIIAPGKSSRDQEAVIKKFIAENAAVVVTVNFLHDDIESDYVFVGNVRRYNYWKNDDRFAKAKKILTSNIDREAENAYTISFIKLIKYGWEHLDNSTLMLLRLLDLFDVKSINIAGFDGYDYTQDGQMNYVSEFMELNNVRENPSKLNDEISSMLLEYKSSRQSTAPVRFITKSRFEYIWKNE